MSQDRQDLPSECGGTLFQLPVPSSSNVTPTLDLVLNRSSSLTGEKCVSDIILDLLLQNSLLFFFKFLSSDQLLEARDCQYFREILL